MNCKFVNIDTTNHLKCGELLFVDKKLGFEDSVRLCKSQNYQLVMVNIKLSDVDDSRYENKTSGSRRPGLKAGNQNCTRSGQRADGEEHGEKSGGKIKLSDENGDCYEVVANVGGLESAFRPRCGGIYFFMCRSSGDAASVSLTGSPTTKPQLVYSSKILSKKYFYTTSKATIGFAKTSSNTTTTKPGSISNGNGYTRENNILIGMSVALCLLFVITLLLMTHIFCKKRNKQNKRNKKNKMLELRYMPAEERLLDDVITTKSCAKNNDITPAVVRTVVDAASLPISCDVFNNDVTPDKVRSTTNDVTTNASFNRAELESDYSLASLPTSCDVRCSDVIITRDDVRDLSEKKAENNRGSVDEDFSFWIHVNEC